MNMYAQPGGRRGWILWSSAIVLLTVLTGLAVVRVVSQPADTSAPAGSIPASSEAPLNPPPAPQPPPPAAPPVNFGNCPPTATACVDERLRISWLQRDGKITYGPVPVMPGSDGPQDSVATPKGTFHVMRKDADHVSSEFGDPMNNAVFFAAGGIAFHEGSLVSTSHGCVHLSPVDSARYFQDLSKGSEVAVF